MSLKRNILANYVSQIYVTLIGIVMVPMYVRYMGAEAYGLVGFFAMLQAWFLLLDMGLTPTMARETARFNGGATDALSLRRLLRAMEGIFIGVALLGGAAMVAGSGTIASSWLKVQQLPLIEVQHAIMLMAVIVALRWVCGLYRGAINGFERLVWLSGFNIAIATARFVLVIPFFIYIGTSPTQFFSYQLVLAVIEVVVLVTQTYRLLPQVTTSKRTPWQWAPLRGVLKFSLSIAFTASVWVLVTQTDKLVLSKLLPLSEYAYFTLAVLVASGVGVISAPISGALLPRMSKLAAEGDDAGVIRLYRNATQLVCVIAIPAALMLAFFAEQVLWAWTGDAAIAVKAAPVLTLYALGNGILALGAFPYYLQFAKGDLRLHMIGNGLFVVLLIPALIWATLQYGVIGAGWAWLVANVVYFLVWVPKVHSRLVKGLHAQWLLRDVGAILLVTVICTVLANGYVAWPKERPQLALGIAVLSLVMVAIAAAASSTIREYIFRKKVRVTKGKVDFEKIKLNKDEVIIFMGSMNAMPMMYALELKKMGYQVIYFVDASRKDKLSRPESHFPDINYPYPSWIIEVVLPSQIFLPLFPRIFSAFYQHLLKSRIKGKIGCFVLNGFFVSLSPYLDVAAKKITLSHGSDLDVWANTEDIDALAGSFKDRSIFKYIPDIVSSHLIKYIVKQQYLGCEYSDVVMYFPTGFNVAGDKVIGQLIDSGVGYISRYDISFEPLQGESRDVKNASETINIFSGVRFLFKTFPDGNEEYNKGNDLIIEGIAKYFLINRNIEVHFVEKGEDVQCAKELCQKFGLEQVVVWHKEMSFKELLALYRESDICFDQLGTHWIGAIGGYALWLGKPLIANDGPAIRSGIWPMDNPVCSASTSEEVCSWLKTLENFEVRTDISNKSKEFVESYMSPNHTLNLMFSFKP